MLSGCNSVVHAQKPPITIPKSAFSAKSLQSIIPQGEKINKVQLLVGNDSAFVVVATSGSLRNVEPGWISVGQWDSGKKKWTLEWIHQGFAFESVGGIASIVLGARYANTHTVALVYSNGASGHTSTIVILGINKNGVRILRTVQTLPGGNIQRLGNKFVITGANYQETDYWNNGQWTYNKLSTHQVLNQADAHVYYVSQTYFENLQEVHATKIVGNPVVHIRVHQTVSFIPADPQTWSQLNDTTIYFGYGNQSFEFTMANMLPGNVADIFDHPGQYRFAIVPPNSSAMSPDQSTAQVTVIVSKH